MQKFLLVSILILSACSSFVTGEKDIDTSVIIKEERNLDWQHFSNGDITFDYPPAASVTTTPGAWIIVDLPRIKPLLPENWTIGRWNISKYSSQDLIDQLGAGEESANAHEREEEKLDIDLNGKPALLVTVTLNKYIKRKRIIIELGDSILTIDNAQDDGLYDAKYDFERFYKSVVIK